MPKNKKPMLKRFSTRILNRPHLILPAKFDEILMVLGDRIGLDVDYDEDSIAQYFLEQVNGQSQVFGHDTAYIPVMGTLVNRSVGMDALSGLTSYDSIRSDFRDALASEDVSKIVLDIDSGGGEAAGLFDLADDIFEARGEKPIFALVNENAYSAAYGIASSAEKVFISRTGGAGSVGVIAMHADQSEFDKNIGVKYTPVFAGDRKNDFNSHQPLSEEANAVLQEQVDDLYKVFTETVARNRGVTVGSVRDTEAGIFQGSKAVDVGFADSVNSIEDSVKYINDFDGSGTMLFVPNNYRKEEEDNMNLNELKTKHPDLVKEIEDGAMATAQVYFNSEMEEVKKTHDAEIDSISLDLNIEKEKNLENEKSESIRIEKENTATCERIWKEKLAESNFPEHLSGKVMKHVQSDQFIEDNVLNAEGFETAVSDEIQDWIDNGVTKEVTVKGASFTEKEPTEGNEPQTENDEKQANSMLSYVQ